MRTHSQQHRFSIGRLLYLFWHKPLGVARNSIAAGGPIEQYIDFVNRQAMIKDACNLPVQRLPLADDLPVIHFLTGRNFWYQTAHCLYSLQQCAKASFRVVIHDDGTLTNTSQIRLKASFPNSSIRLRAESNKHLEVEIPESRYPFIQDRRRHYPNILCLTDSFIGEHGWHLSFDSDMLFFRPPGFLLAWMQNPTMPLHLVDVADSYGYSNSLMERLAGAPIPSKLNMGILGLNADQLNWPQLEDWCKTLITNELTSYYLSQALAAMIVAPGARAIAPATDYIVLPTAAEARNPKTVMHHYVAHSKRGYLRYAWRKARQIAS